MSQGQFTTNNREVHPDVVPLNAIPAEEVSFLWSPYLPLGKLTILEGDPGVGKTWLALQLAALVSTGAPFPDPANGGRPGERREPAQVLYLTAEDGLGDTLRPRLERCGAEVERVFALTGYRRDEDLSRVLPVTLTNFEVLRKAMSWLPALRLVVVDPVQGFFGADVDMHRANETRPVLAGLARLAEEFGVAVLLIRHLGKAPADRAVYRGLGSIDLAAAARSIILVGQDPQNKQKRVMAHVKSSLAEAGPSLAFELREGAFLWAGTSPLGASDLLRPDEGDEERSALEEAREFLVEMLADGPRPAKEVMKEARKAGIARMTLRRAKTSLDVRVRREGGRTGTWFWELKGAHPAHSFTMSIFKKAAKPARDKEFEPEAEDAQMSIFEDTPEPLAAVGVRGGFKDAHGGRVDQADDPEHLCETGGGDAAGTDPPDEPTPPRGGPCPRCGGRDFWFSIAGSRLCERCHPPDSDRIVARREVLGDD